MKRLLVLGLLLATSVGCSGMNNTQAGAVEGGVVGGVLGTIVGAAFRNPLAGAAIGAGAGALVGGTAGAQEDRREDRVKQAVAAQQAQMMSLTDVVTMTQQHVPDEMIINQINATHSNFNLTASEITYMREQGVSDRVISVMQYRRGGQVVYGRPGYVYVEQPPPVVGGVIVTGGGWRRGGW